MQLHCLGTAGYHPNVRRHTSCFFLPESGIVLDAGSGLFRLAEWIRERSPQVQSPEVRSLDVLLSHAHLDHTFGLTFLVGMLARRPIDRLSVWGEPEKLAAIREHLFHELLFPVPLPASWNGVIAGESFEAGDAVLPRDADGRGKGEVGREPPEPPGAPERATVRVSTRRQTHPGGSVAYRLEWPSGKSLVYATDTTGDHPPKVLEWMSGADLLVHECYFQDRHRAWAERTGHSWASRVAEVAAATRPKTLVLTHIDPSCEEADPVDVTAIGKSYAGRVIVAEDGLVIDF